MTSVKETAIAYAKLGIPVLPVWRRGKIKGPYTANGHHDRTTDLAQIEAWWARWPNAQLARVPADTNHIVIDGDLGNDLPPLPPTQTVQTPSTGKHYWYSTGLKFGQRKPPFEHVDIRSDAGWVIVPPSEGYTVIDDREPVPLPEWLEAMLYRAPQEARKAAPGIERVDLDTCPGELSDEAERLISQDLTAHGEPLEGKGSDTRAYRIACKLRELSRAGKALSNEAIAEMLHVAWAPDFDYNWLALKVANADEYAENESGADPVETNEEAFKQFLSGVAPVSLKPYRRGDLRAANPKEVRYIIPGWIERGIVNFVCAPGKMHKSRLVLQMGLCVSSGRPVFGEPVEQCSFVFNSYEDDFDEVVRREHAMTRRLGLPEDSDVHYFDMHRSSKDPLFKQAPALAEVDEFQIRTTPFYDQMRDYLKAIPGHKFWVLDSCYNVLDFKGKAMVNQRAVGQAIGLLEALCAECDCTIVILWHPSAAGAERGDASGFSEAWKNAPRRRLMIEKAKTIGYTLSVAHANHGPASGSITLVYDKGALVPADTSKQMVSLRDAAVAVAIRQAELGEPIKRDGKVGNVSLGKYKGVLSAIEQRTGVSYSSKAIMEALTAAEQLGMIAYRSAAPGRNALPAGYVEKR